MTRWRQWVIDAFNRDSEPFDRFTIEQASAGDLLPDATQEEKKSRARFNPQSHDQFRRGRDSGGISCRLHHRPRQYHGHGMARFDRRLRAMSMTTNTIPIVARRIIIACSHFFNNVPGKGLDGLAKGNAGANSAVGGQSPGGKADEASKRIRGKGGVRFDGGRERSRRRAAEMGAGNRITNGTAAPTNAAASTDNSSTGLSNTAPDSEAARTRQPFRPSSPFRCMTGTKAGKCDLKVYFLKHHFPKWAKANEAADAVRKAETDF